MISPRPGPAWTDFIEIVSDRTDGSWLFRGQTEAIWGLSPSAGRPQKLGPAGYRANDEREMFLAFKREAIRFEDRLTKDLEWLALAQHHALPTRLLDWSTNPLVAAWFACENEESSAAGGLHMIWVPAHEIADEVDDPFDLTLRGVTLVRVPPRAARITAQQGLFSLHPDPTAEWDPRAAPVRYEKLEIPVAEKPYFRQALHAFGINRGRLMIDLDGVCATLAWGYRTRI